MLQLEILSTGTDASRGPPPAYESVEYIEKNHNFVEKIIEDKDILPWMTVADLLITDTSSVAYEFLLLDRPVITYQASARLEKGIDITEPEHLIGAITRSIEDPGEYKKSRQDVLSDIHPYSDGQSSQRLISTISNILQSDELDWLQPKPRNWIRKKQIRKIVSL